MKRDFATPIDSKLLDRFKEVCKKKGFKMNEVIEIYMQDFISGNIEIEKEIKYRIKKEK